MKCLAFAPISTISDSLNIYGNGEYGLNGSYDSSADYWKLTADGGLQKDADGWLKNAQGKYMNTDGTLSDEPIPGKTIGSQGIETGLLNILNGGTSDSQYDSYSLSQIEAAQGLMFQSGIKPTSGADPLDLRARSWGNSSGTISKGRLSAFDATIADGVFQNMYSSEIKGFAYNNRDMLMKQTGEAKWARINSLAKVERLQSNDILGSAIKLPAGNNVSDIFDSAGFSDNYFKDLMQDADTGETYCTVPLRAFLKAAGKAVGDNDTYKKWLPEPLNAKGQTEEWLSNNNLGQVSFEGLSEDQARDRLAQIQELAKVTPIIFSMKPSDDDIAEYKRIHDREPAWHNAIVGELQNTFAAYYLDSYAGQSNTWFRNAESGPAGRTLAEYQAIKGNKPIMSLIQAGTFAKQVPINAATNNWNSTWYKQVTNNNQDRKYASVYFFYLK